MTNNARNIFTRLIFPSPAVPPKINSVSREQGVRPLSGSAGRAEGGPRSGQSPRYRTIVRVLSRIKCRRTIDEYARIRGLRSPSFVSPDGLTIDGLIVWTGSV